MAGRGLDFFISYSPADERWATWIAWELEAAGYRTMVQAWDFVPGTNFIDFMDRGVSEAVAVIAVLSPNYLQSRYGRLEWQAAYRADPEDPGRKLITVRVEDCPLDGLLATVTWLDLLDVTDEQQARAMLFARIEQALTGRAKPDAHPGFPNGHGQSPNGRANGVRAAEASDGAAPAAYEGRRRTPGARPEFPRGRRGGALRRDVSILHMPGPRFGRGLPEEGLPSDAETLQARVWGGLTRAIDGGAPHPDLLIVTGDLTASGGARETDEAVTYVTGLRVLLGLEPEQVVVVPGPRDVSAAACRAYFASCEADDIDPRPPYWPKWRHFARLFGELYQGIDTLVFDGQQPWTLFEIPSSQVVVAGLNSTMAATHRPDDDYGHLGEVQAAWFANRLRQYERDGWLRIGALAHVPRPAARPAADASSLRDSATLDRLLGTLNFVVHGPDPDGAEINALDSGLPLVPTAGPGQPQLLRVTSRGLTRWTNLLDGTARSSSVELPWRSVGTTFADAPAKGAAEPPRGEAYADDDARPDPTAALLDRVAEVCQARYERVRIRPVTGDPSYLYITVVEHGYARDLRIGAHAGRVDRDVLAAFVAGVHATDPTIPSELVYAGPAPAEGLRQEAQRRGVRLRSFTEFQGVLDLAEFVTEQTAQLDGDPLYPPGWYVPQRFRDALAPDSGVHEDVVEELLRLVSADDGRFVLLLGDFGRGKTFALRELARRLPSELPHLIPILIDLRSLDKANSVDGLVAAHLATHGNELIDLKAFWYMLEQGRVVLIFDGFDELVTRITYDRAADHLETLLRAARENAKIVVASRTQHFRSQEQVLTALGERVGLLPQRRLLTLQEFTADQIRGYLVNRYGTGPDGGESAADERLALFRDIEDLLGLARNPRMLGFLADLDAERLRTVAATGGSLSAAALYREIVDSWLRYEEGRSGRVRGSAAGLGYDELWQAVTVLALRLWQSGEAFLRIGDLSEVGEALAGLTSARLTPRQTEHAMGAGSMLIRTDEGLFGFIHESVAEWLVADEIARRLTAGDGTLLAHRTLSQLTVDFLCDLTDHRICREWAEAALATEDEVTTANALKIASRLRTPVRANLRGAHLAGEDLSHRDMRGIDLSEADLTGARLNSTNLVGARLAGARLVGARLDGADLSGADLTGADLTRARLLGANLRGAVISGGSWLRAAVVGASTTDAHGRPELRAAAVAPGEPVHVGLAPAAVSVPYGFEVGRIPDPVAFSPDGMLMAVASDDGGVVLCDAATGLPVRTLQGHRNRVYAVRYSHLGGVLVTAAADGTARIWDTVTYEQRHVLGGHNDWVWPVTLNSDGSLVATGDTGQSTGTTGGRVRLWDTATGEARYSLGAHAARVWAIAFSRDGSLLATGDGDGTVRLFETATGAPFRETATDGGSAYRVKFSPDARQIAGVFHDGDTRIWDVATGELVARLPGTGRSTYSLTFHPDGHLLATGDNSGAVCVWTLDGLTRQVVTTHSGNVYGLRFSPDGTVLASGDSDGVVRLSDSATGEVRREIVAHRGSVWPIAFHPDGHTFATSSNGGAVRIWDTVTGEPVHVVRGHGRRLTLARYSPDGGSIATCGSDGEVRVWDAATGRLSRRRTLRGDQVVSLFYSPVGSLLGMAGSNGNVHLWNPSANSYQRELAMDTDYVWTGKFSPDGDVLATANDDDTVRLWYRTTGRLINTFAEHSGRVRSIAFSRDGRMLATGCDDRSVRIWDLEAARCVAMLEGHGDRVYSVAFTGDGATLASVSNDGTARIWDVASGECRSVLTRGSGRWWSAAISPDDTLLATAGDDLAVRLWDITTGEYRHTLLGHTRRVWSVDFAPDGRSLVSASDDGSAIVWDLTALPEPTRRMTLLGLPNGWAAFAPDGRYKLEGEVADELWHTIGTCRFELGELDPHLTDVRRIALDADF